MKQVIAGMLNPGMFSLSPIVDVACYFDDEETHVESERTKPKIAAKPKRNGAPLEGDNDASILRTQPPSRSVKFLTGHVHCWAFLWAIFRQRQAGKPIAIYNNPWLQVATRVHK